MHSPKKDKGRGIHDTKQARQSAGEDLLQARQALELRAEELADSLAMMRAVLESSSDGIVTIDVNHRITSYNEKFLDMWRIPRALMEQEQQIAIAMHVAAQLTDPTAFLQRIEDICATSPEETRDVLETVDGTCFERFSKQHVVNGRPIGRVWIFRDITERRRTEMHLRDKSRTLELLNETGKSLVSTLDQHTLVQLVTDAATQLSGAAFGAFFYSIQSPEGDALQLYALSGAPREAFEHLGRPRATPLFGPIFRNEQPIRCDDVLQDPRYARLPPHDGMPAGHLPVRSYLAVPVISRSGEALGGMLFGHPEPARFSDRTEKLVIGFAAQAAIAIDNARLYEAAQKAAHEREELLANERYARAEAERMSAMKDEFLATLSHELRTPLSAILGWSQVLKRGLDGGVDMHKGLDTIERNARTQAQLIEDLLDVSRITSGQVRLDVQPIEAASFIEAALETVRPAADAKGIALHAWLEPATGIISGDANRLQQVVWNLVSNAIKFTPAGGKVSVFLERANGMIRIRVSDTGVGIAPAFLGHVFERFRQGDGSTTRRYGGLGLGLAIVKSLVEQHGGTVSAQSPGEGGGATFTVSLPPSWARPPGNDDTPAQHKASMLPPPEFKPLDLSRLKVLVVDDEADARELVKHVLNLCKAQVFTAASAAEGLSIIMREHPDVLVSDIGMPEVDGYEFMRRVRALPQHGGGGVAAIALTAFARAEDRAKALQAGFSARVLKPVEPSELVAAVAGVAGSGPHAVPGPFRV